jgi:hypothetical protein
MRVEGDQAGAVGTAGPPANRHEPQVSPSARGSARAGMSRSAQCSYRTERTTAARSLPAERPRGIAGRLFVFNDESGQGKNDAQVDREGIGRELKSRPRKRVGMR